MNPLSYSLRLGTIFFVHTTKKTLLFQGKEIDRAEFLRQAGLMALIALFSGWLTSKVVNKVDRDADDSWAGDYRGV